MSTERSFYCRATEQSMHRSNGVGQGDQALVIINKSLVELER